jgi:hypothetical protein
MFVSHRATLGRTAISIAFVATLVVTPASHTNAAAPAMPQLKDEALVVEDSGFGQDKKRLSFGFVVRNPNDDQAVTRTEYQVAFYDADDTIVETETGYVDIALPGQTVGVAGNTYLDDGVEVKRIEVQLSEGDFEDLDPVASFEADPATYWPGDFTDKVTTVVKSPYSKLVEDVRVSAIAYDDAGKIIGGGYTFLGFVPAEGEAAVSVSVTALDTPSKVDVYAVLSALSLMYMDKAEGDNKPIELLAQGNSTKGNKIGYAFSVSNPNTDKAIENSRYQVAAYDEDGRVLEAGSGYIGLMLPGEKLSVADTIYLPDDIAIKSLVVQVKTGTAENSKAASPLSASKVTFKDDRYSPKVTGVIKSTHKKKLENLPVYAVAYDAKGNLIGGGYTYLNFVPANGQAPIEVYVTVAAKPAKVELFAALSSLDQLK